MGHPQQCNVSLSFELQIPAKSSEVVTLARRGRSHSLPKIIMLEGMKRLVKPGTVIIQRVKEILSPNLHDSGVILSK
ncbi:MAG: hypothetical protein GY806_15675 [Gammaproteobacteria bacterium]|nr:hypothetical protein [Gammaproteobacteria bacterium]